MSIIDHATYFTNLPREYYRSEERYTRELEAVYGRQWQYVAHVSQMPAAGDYLACDLPGGESVIVVRNGEGAINAFYNVCRHRGFSLCEAGAGRAKLFVCPYHKWAYDLDGRLRGAPAMPNGKYFDYQDQGLKPVHVETWRGFVFVNLSEDVPQPLGPRIDATTPDFARLETEHLKVAHHKVYTIETNWKFLLENYLECSHCASVHAHSLCVPMDLPAIFNDVIDSIAVDEVVPMWIPLKAHSKSLSMDGEFVSSRLLGEFGRGAAGAEGFAAGFMTMPAVSGILFQSDHGVVHRIDPVSPTRTLLHNWWFVHEDAVEGVDYDFDNLVAVWNTTNPEDARILERQQRGVQSRGFIPGPHDAKVESSMRAGLALYLQMMGED
jgi:phenylpropionate dioxygenase-like ring-hydroxylating dioxygenase large terminal subunit